MNKAALRASLGRDGVTEPGPTSTRYTSTRWWVSSVAISARFSTGPARSHWSWEGLRDRIELVRRAARDRTEPPQVHVLVQFAAVTAEPAAAVARWAGDDESSERHLDSPFVLVGDEEPDRFSGGDVRRVLMAKSLEDAGIPLDGVAAAFRLGPLSLDFLDAAAFERFAALDAETFQQVSERTGIPLELLTVVRQPSCMRRMAAVSLRAPWPGRRKSRPANPQRRTPSRTRRAKLGWPPAIGTYNDTGAAGGWDRYNDGYGICAHFTEAVP